MAVTHANFWCDETARAGQPAVTLPVFPLRL
jgi:hypothetical protein